MPRGANSVPTSQQRKMAELLVAGEYTIVEAYTIAYEQTPEQQQNRNSLANRAYMASRSAGVKRWVEKLQQEQAAEEARTLVWDKRKAAHRLMQCIHEVEVNVEITRRLRDEAMNDPEMNTSKKLNQMLKVAQIDNDTMRLIKECISEMNGMYGLTNPSVNMTAALQVIIGGPEELPPDTVDE